MYAHDFVHLDARDPQHSMAGLSMLAHIIYHYLYIASVDAPRGVSIPRLKEKIPSASNLLLRKGMTECGKQTNVSNM